MDMSFYCDGFRSAHCFTMMIITVALGGLPTYLSRGSLGPCVWLLSPEMPAFWGPACGPVVGPAAPGAPKGGKDPGLADGRPWPDAAFTALLEPLLLLLLLLLGNAEPAVGAEGLEEEEEVLDVCVDAGWGLDCVRSEPSKGCAARYGAGGGRRVEHAREPFDTSITS